MRLAGLYILNEHGQPVPCKDVMAWAQWAENSDNRIVARTEIEGVLVSTIFLGCDHGWGPLGGDEPPILWETMYFGGTMNHQLDRCSGNREQAEAMHAAMVEKLEAVLHLAK